MVNWIKSHTVYYICSGWQHITKTLQYVDLFWWFQLVYIKQNDLQHTFWAQFQMHCNGTVGNIFEDSHQSFSNVCKNVYKNAIKSPRTFQNTGLCSNCSCWILLWRGPNGTRLRCRWGHFYFILCVADCAAIGINILNVSGNMPSKMSFVILSAILGIVMVKE